MSVPTLVIILTLLFLCYGLLWHDETADQIRNGGPGGRQDS